MKETTQPVAGLWTRCMELYDGLIRIQKVQQSQDGTTKILFALHDGQTIECVIMCMPRSHTLCLSTQVGCALRCCFCSTGRIGFIRNLRREEIIAQATMAAWHLHTERNVWPERLVFMGMGEPFLNKTSLFSALDHLTSTEPAHLSWRKILVSTVGIPSMLRQFGTMRLGLPAISLHAPNQHLRDQLMPGSTAWPLTELIDVLRTYPLPGRERIMIEYILLDGINDQPEHAQELSNLLQGLPIKVNLIPYNPFPESAFRPSPPEKREEFLQTLKNMDIPAFFRRGLGPDINAACGQLRASYSSGHPKETP